MARLRLSRSLVVLVVLAGLTLPASWARAQAPAWDPHKTRAFVVCLAKFKGEKEPSFSTEDRLDTEFVRLLEERGIPKDQLVFLQDEAATTDRIQAAFRDLLRRSKQDEFLLFYFGSHGSYDPDEGTYEFSTYDGSLPFTWVFDAIERDFRGGRALLTADCCYSGGLAEWAARRRTNIAYACLTSAYAHDVAWSEWRFVQCLVRGFEGDSLLDPDGAGYITLAGLAHYTERYLAFAAEGRPSFVTTNGFDAGLRLARVEGKRGAGEAGKLVEVKVDGEWHKAEVVSSNGTSYKVRYVDSDAPAQTRFEAGEVRSFRPAQFAVGARVQVQDPDDENTWSPAAVLASWGSLHLCRFDGHGPAHDEWVGPSRIRAAH